MTKSIEVTCGSGSSLDGVKFKFDAEIVTLGRHPSNDIAFSAEKDRVVSGHHVELRFSDDVLWLHDLGSSNGTFVNGQRIKAAVALRVGDEIVLGKDGANLFVTSPSMPAAPKGAASPSLPRARPRKTPSTESVMKIVSEAGQHERQRHRTIIYFLMVAIGLLIVGVMVGFFWLLGGGAENRVKEAARKEARNEAELTARGVAERTSRGLRRDANARLEELSSTFKQRLSESNRGFSDVFPKIEKSVYPVFRKRKVGSSTRMYSGGGTCWVVAPGVLATNAHVAEGHLKTGTTLVVRAGDPVRDFEVQRVKIHPGYVRWSRLRREYLPLDPNGSGFLQFIPACDVALMWCRPEATAAFGPPLAMASDEALRSLARGTPAAFLGYPVEGGIVGALERTKASSDIGPISQVFDFFLEKNETRFEQLVTYNFKGEGGASGSPVVGLDSKVVAVHSAGNFKSIGGQRISQGSTAFGQRVDLVRQLLDGSEVAELQALEKNWRKRFLSLWSSNHDPALALREIKARSSWPRFPALKGRKIRAGSLKPGAGEKTKFRAGKSWALVALVTGRRFGKIGMRGAVSSMPNTWQVAVSRRNAGAHQVEVYQAKSGSDTVNYELWLFNSK
ncbi:MAG: FHA domain-containing protein [Planctomycetota bacterium]